jgi:5S rRNA maturation endonuclease (ribonuclease M5)
MQPIGTDIERAERLRRVLQTLCEVNKQTPVIVEGKRDALALRKVGLIGDIITLHAGRGLYDFCEDIAGRYQRVILLMDWDVKGDMLHKKVSDNLHGMWEEFSPLREIVRVLCQKEIKDIEGIPGLYRRLAGEEASVSVPGHEDAW